LDLANWSQTPEDLRVEAMTAAHALLGLDRRGVCRDLGAPPRADSGFIGFDRYAGITPSRRRPV
jgi:hypothetical protein